MSVKVVHKKSGEETVGKYVSIKEGKVNLYTGITPNSKGGWRGCGRCFRFPVDDVVVSADDPATELNDVA